MVLSNVFSFLLTDYGKGRRSHDDIALRHIAGNNAEDMEQHCTSTNICWRLTVVNFMMERLQKKVKVCSLRFPLLENPAPFIQSQWTKPATFILKIMNSTVMSLSLEQTGELDNSKISDLIC